MTTIYKFPYSVSRRAYSRMGRCSKNGTPEEWAAKAAAEGINLSVNKISYLIPKTPSKEITPSQSPPSAEEFLALVAQLPESDLPWVGDMMRSLLEKPSRR
jgi:hypothetical protein